MYLGTVCKKVSAVIILICFLSGECLRPAGALAMPLAAPEIPIAASFQLDLPPDLGTVDTLIAGNNPTTIIHIQEAHGDAASQQKIEKILHYLKNRYGIDMLLLEGNAFKLHPDLLNFFPSRAELNSSILENLAQQGLASGPVFFLQKEPAAEAWGIEDVKSYRANGQDFIEVLTQREKTSQFVRAMDQQIERLSAPYLGKKLRGYLKRVEEFESGLLSFDAWLTKQKEAAASILKQDLGSPALQLEWPMLVRFFVLRDFEKKLNLKAFESEREKFLKELARVGAIHELPLHQGQIREDKTDLSFGDQVARLLRAPLSQNRLPDPETGLLFENMVAALPQNFSYSNYPNVTLFIGHLILQSELKAGRLYEELQRLTDAITEVLAQSPREKEIAGLLKKYRLLMRLFQLELSPQDYEEIKELEKGKRGKGKGKREEGGRWKVEGKEEKGEREKEKEDAGNVSDKNNSVILSEAGAGDIHSLSLRGSVQPRPKQSLRPSIFVQQFTQLNSDKRVRNFTFSHLEELDHLFETALNFYHGAKERDGKMIEKIEERLKASGKTKAAVITGGFHSEPFKNYFEQKGYNYALITPRMTEAHAQEHEGYVQSMLQNYIAPLRGGKDKDVHSVDDVVSSPPLRQTAATYRAMDFSANNQFEIKAQGGNAARAQSSILDSMKNQALKAGLPAAEVHARLRIYQAVRLGKIVRSEAAVVSPFLAVNKPELRSEVRKQRKTKLQVPPTHEVREQGMNIQKGLKRRHILWTSLLIASMGFAAGGILLREIEQPPVPAARSLSGVLPLTVVYGNHDGEGRFEKAKPYFKEAVDAAPKNAKGEPLAAYLHEAVNLNAAKDMIFERVSVADLVTKDAKGKEVATRATTDKFLERLKKLLADYRGNESMRKKMEKRRQRLRVEQEGFFPDRLVPALSKPTSSGGASAQKFIDEENLALQELGVPYAAFEDGTFETDLLAVIAQSENEQMKRVLWAGDTLAVLDYSRNSTATGLESARLREISLNQQIQELWEKHPRLTLLHFRGHVHKQFYPLLVGKNASARHVELTEDSPGDYKKLQKYTQPFSGSIKNIANQKKALLMLIVMNDLVLPLEIIEKLEKDLETLNSGDAARQIDQIVKGISRYARGDDQQISEAILKVLRDKKYLTEKLYQDLSAKAALLRSEMRSGKEGRVSGADASFFGSSQWPERRRPKQQLRPLQPKQIHTWFLSSFDGHKSHPVMKNMIKIIQEMSRVFKENPWVKSLLAKAPARAKLYEFISVEAKSFRFGFVSMFFIGFYASRVIYFNQLNYDFKKIIPIPFLRGGEPARSEVRGVREAVDALRDAGLIGPGERFAYYGSGGETYSETGGQRFEVEKGKEIIKLQSRGIKTAVAAFDSLEMLDEQAGALKLLLRSLQAGTIYLALKSELIPTDAEKLRSFVSQITNGFSNVLTPAGLLRVATHLDKSGLPQGILQITFSGAEPLQESPFARPQQFAKAPAASVRVAAPGFRRRSEMRSSAPAGEADFFSEGGSSKSSKPLDLFAYSKKVNHSAQLKALVSQIPGAAQPWQAINNLLDTPGWISGAAARESHIQWYHEVTWRLLEGDLSGAADGAVRVRDQLISVRDLAAIQHFDDFVKALRAQARTDLKKEEPAWLRETLKRIQPLKTHVRSKILARWIPKAYDNLWIYLRTLDRIDAAVLEAGDKLDPRLLSALRITAQDQLKNTPVLLKLAALRIQQASDRFYPESETDRDFDSQVMQLEKQNLVYPQDWLRRLVISLGSAEAARDELRSFLAQVQGLRFAFLRIVFSGDIQKIKFELQAKTQKVALYRKALVHQYLNKRTDDNPFSQMFGKENEAIRRIAADNLRAAYQSLKPLTSIPHKAFLAAVFFWGLTLLGVVDLWAGAFRAPGYEPGGFLDFFSAVTLFTSPVWAGLGLMIILIWWGSGSSQISLRNRAALIFSPYIFITRSDDPKPFRLNVLDDVRSFLKSAEQDGFDKNSEITRRSEIRSRGLPSFFEKFDKELPGLLQAAVADGSLDQKMARRIQRAYDKQINPDWWGYADPPADDWLRKQKAASFALWVSELDVPEWRYRYQSVFLYDFLEPGFDLTITRPESKPQDLQFQFTVEIKTQRATARRAFLADAVDDPALQTLAQAVFDLDLIMQKKYHRALTGFSLFGMVLGFFAVISQIFLRILLAAIGEKEGGLLVGAMSAAMITAAALVSMFPKQDTWLEQGKRNFFKQQLQIQKTQIQVRLAEYAFSLNNLSRSEVRSRENEPEELIMVPSKKEMNVLFAPRLVAISAAVYYLLQWIQNLLPLPPQAKAWVMPLEGGILAGAMIGSWFENYWKPYEKEVRERQDQKDYTAFKYFLAHPAFAALNRIVQLGLVALTEFLIFVVLLPWPPVAIMSGLVSATAMLFFWSLYDVRPYRLQQQAARGDYTALPEVGVSAAEIPAAFENETARTLEMIGEELEQIHSPKTYTLMEIRALQGKYSRLIKAEKLMSKDIMLLKEFGYISRMVFVTYIRQALKAQFHPLIKRRELAAIRAKIDANLRSHENISGMTFLSLVEIAMVEEGLRLKEAQEFLVPFWARMPEETNVDRQLLAHHREASELFFDGLSQEPQQNEIRLLSELFLESFYSPAWSEVTQRELYAAMDAAIEAKVLETDKVNWGLPISLAVLKASAHYGEDPEQVMRYLAGQIQALRDSKKISNLTFYIFIDEIIYEAVVKRHNGVLLELAEKNDEARQLILWKIKSDFKTTEIVSATRLHEAIERLDSADQAQGSVYEDVLRKIKSYYPPDAPNFEPHTIIDRLIDDLRGRSEVRWAGRGEDELIRVLTRDWGKIKRQGAFVFDMQKTLTGRKEAATPEMIRLLAWLLEEGIRVVIDSGNTDKEVLSQVVDPLKTELAARNKMALMQHVMVFANSGTLMLGFDFEGATVSFPEYQRALMIPNEVTHALEDILTQAAKENWLIPQESKPEILGSWEAMYRKEEQKSKGVSFDLSALRGAENFRPSVVHFPFLDQAPRLTGPYIQIRGLVKMPDGHPRPTAIAVTKLHPAIRQQILEKINAELKNKLSAAVTEDLHIAAGGESTIDITSKRANKALALVALTENQSLLAWRQMRHAFEKAAWLEMFKAFLRWLGFVLKRNPIRPGLIYFHGDEITGDVAGALTGKAHPGNDLIVMNYNAYPDAAYGEIKGISVAPFPPVGLGKNEARTFYTGGEQSGIQRYLSRLQSSILLAKTGFDRRSEVRSAAPVRLDIELAAGRADAAAVELRIQFGEFKKAVIGHIGDRGIGFGKKGKEAMKPVVAARMALEEIKSRLGNSAFNQNGEARRPAAEGVLEQVDVLRRSYQPGNKLTEKLAGMPDFMLQLDAFETALKVLIRPESFLTQTAETVPNPAIEKVQALLTAYVTHYDPEDTFGLLPQMKSIRQDYTANAKIPSEKVAGMLSNFRRFYAAKPYGGHRERAEAMLTIHSAMVRGILGMLPGAQAALTEIDSFLQSEQDSRGERLKDYIETEILTPLAAGQFNEAQAGMQVFRQSQASLLPALGFFAKSLSAAKTFLPSRSEMRSREELEKKTFKGSMYRPEYYEKERQLASQTPTIAVDFSHMLAYITDFKSGLRPAQFRVRPGIRKQLAKLKDHGYRLVLWTKESRDALLDFWEGHPEIAALFDHAITRENFTVTWPIFEEAGTDPLSEVKAAYAADGIPPEATAAYYGKNKRIKDIAFLKHRWLIDDAEEAAVFVMDSPLYNHWGYEEAYITALHFDGSTKRKENRTFVEALAQNIIDQDRARFGPPSTAPAKAKQSGTNSLDIWRGIDLEKTLAYGRGYNDQGFAIYPDSYASVGLPANSSGYRNWFVQRIGERFGPHLNILVLGPGPGQLEEALQNAGHALTAVEADSHFVKALITRKIQHVIEGDARQLDKLGLAEQSFDLVLISNAVGALGLNSLEKARRYLKPGGHLVIADAVFSDERNQTLAAQNIPFIVSSPEQIQQAFARFGYKDEGLEYTPQFLIDEALHALGYTEQTFAQRYPDQPEEILKSAALYFASTAPRSEIRTIPSVFEKPELNFGREEKVLPRPAYAAALPYISWLDIQDKLAAFTDPASLQGKQVIESVINVLMRDSSDLSRAFYTLYEKLLMAEDWDRYVLDSIEAVVRETARQSVANLLEEQSPEQTEGARRRLYEMAYIRQVPQYYKHNVELPELTQRRERLVSGNQSRLKHVHEILMQEIGKARAMQNAAQKPGYGLLTELIPVLENKDKLANYAYHAAKSSRFASIREFGLTTSKMEPGDENPENVFFHDWMPLASIGNSAYDYGANTQFYVRVRKDAPTVHETRIEGAEFHDNASDFLGTDIPPEWVELIDPYRPWIGYPIQNLESLEQFLQEINTPSKRSEMRSSPQKRFGDERIALMSGQTIPRFIEPLSGFFISARDLKDEVYFALRINKGGLFAVTDDDLAEMDFNTLTQNIDERNLHDYTLRVYGREGHLALEYEPYEGSEHAADTKPVRWIISGNRADHAESHELVIFNFGLARKHRERIGKIQRILKTYRDGAAGDRAVIESNHNIAALEAELSRLRGDLFSVHLDRERNPADRKRFQKGFTIKRINEDEEISFEILVDRESQRSEVRNLEDVVNAIIGVLDIAKNERGSLSLFDILSGRAGPRISLPEWMAKGNAVSAWGDLSLNIEKIPDTFLQPAVEVIRQRIQAAFWIDQEQARRVLTHLEETGVEWFDEQRYAAGPEEINFLMGYVEPETIAVGRGVFALQEEDKDFAPAFVFRTALESLNRKLRQASQKEISSDLTDSLFKDKTEFDRRLDDLIHLNDPLFLRSAVSRFKHFEPGSRYFRTFDLLKNWIEFQMNQPQTAQEEDPYPVAEQAGFLVQKLWPLFIDQTERQKPETASAYFRVALPFFAFAMHRQQFFKTHVQVYDGIMREIDQSSIQFYEAVKYYFRKVKEIPEEQDIILADYPDASVAEHVVNQAKLFVKMGVEKYGRHYNPAESAVGDAAFTLQASKRLWSKISRKEIQDGRRVFDLQPNFVLTAALPEILDVGNTGKYLKEVEAAGALMLRNLQWLSAAIQLYAPRETTEANRSIFMEGYIQGDSFQPPDALSAVQLFYAKVEQGNLMALSDTGDTETFWLGIGEKIEDRPVVLDAASGASVRLMTVGGTPVNAGTAPRNLVYYRAEQDGSMSAAVYKNSIIAGLLAWFHIKDDPEYFGKLEDWEKPIAGIWPALLRLRMTLSENPALEDGYFSPWRADMATWADAILNLRFIADSAFWRTVYRMKGDVKTSARDPAIPKLELYSLFRNPDGLLAHLASHLEQAPGTDRLTEDAARAVIDTLAALWWSGAPRYPRVNTAFYIVLEEFRQRMRFHPDGISVENLQELKDFLTKEFSDVPIEERPREDVETWEQSTQLKSVIERHAALGDYSRFGFDALHYEPPSLDAGHENFGFAQKRPLLSSHYDAERMPSENLLHPELWPAWKNYPAAAAMEWAGRYESGGIALPGSSHRIRFDENLGVQPGDPLTVRVVAKPQQEQGLAQVTILRQSRESFDALPPEALIAESPGFESYNHLRQFLQWGVTEDNAGKTLRQAVPLAEGRKEALLASLDERLVQLRQTLEARGASPLFLNIAKTIIDGIRTADILKFPEYRKLDSSGEVVYLFAKGEPEHIWISQELADSETETPVAAMLLFIAGIDHIVKSEANWNTEDFVTLMDLVRAMFPDSEYFELTFNDYLRSGFFLFEMSFGRLMAPGGERGKGWQKLPILSNVQVKPAVSPFHAAAAAMPAPEAEALAGIQEAGFYSLPGGTNGLFAFDLPGGVRKETAERVAVHIPELHGQPLLMYVHSNFDRIDFFSKDAAAFIGSIKKTAEKFESQSGAVAVLPRLTTLTAHLLPQTTVEYMALHALENRLQPLMSTGRTYTRLDYLDPGIPNGVPTKRVQLDLIRGRIYIDPALVRDTETAYTLVLQALEETDPVYLVKTRTKEIRQVNPYVNKVIPAEAPEGLSLAEMMAGSGYQDIPELPPYADESLLKAWPDKGMEYGELYAQMQKFRQRQVFLRHIDQYRQKENKRLGKFVNAEKFRKWLEQVIDIKPGQSFYFATQAKAVEYSIDGLTGLQWEGKASGIYMPYEGVGVATPQYFGVDDRGRFVLKKNSANTDTRKYLFLRYQTGEVNASGEPVAVLDVFDLETGKRIENQEMDMRRREAAMDDAFNQIIEQADRAKTQLDLNRLQFFIRAFVEGIQISDAEWADYLVYKEKEAKKAKAAFVPGTRQQVLLDVKTQVLGHLSQILYTVLDSENYPEEMNFSVLRMMLAHLKAGPVLHETSGLVQRIQKAQNTFLPTTGEPRAAQRLLDHLEFYLVASDQWPGLEDAASPEYADKLKKLEQEVLVPLVQYSAGLESNLLAREFMSGLFENILPNIREYVRLQLEPFLAARVEEIRHNGIMALLPQYLQAYQPASFPGRPAGVAITPVERYFILEAFEQAEQARREISVAEAAEKATYHTQYGGVDIGASSALIEYRGSSILVDAGVMIDDKNTPPKWPAFQKRPDAILITHDHVDHVGALIKLWRDHLNKEVPIYMTQGSAELLPYVLSFMLIETEDGSEPVYSSSEIGEIMQHVHVLESGQWYEAAPGMKVYFHERVGHLHGAASLVVSTPDSTTLITGDISYRAQGPVPAWEDIPEEIRRHIDRAVIESTYGMLRRKPEEQEEKKFLRFMQERFNAGGKVLVPAFANGRTQRVLKLVLDQIFKPEYHDPSEPKLSKNLKIYIDGQAAWFTLVYINAYADQFKPYASWLKTNLVIIPSSSWPVKNDKQLYERFPNLRGIVSAEVNTRSQSMEAGRFRSRLGRWKWFSDVLREDAMERDEKHPTLIISSSGNATMGRSHGWSARLVNNPVHGLAFIGYMDPEEAGSSLLKFALANRGVKRALAKQFTFKEIGSVPVLAQVEEFGLSGHIQGQDMMKILETIGPSLKEIIIQHGNDRARQAVLEWISENHPEWNPHQIKTGERYPGAVPLTRAALAERKTFFDSLSAEPLPGKPASVKTPAPSGSLAEASQDALIGTKTLYDQIKASGTLFNAIGKLQDGDLKLLASLTEPIPEGGKLILDKTDSHPELRVKVTPAAREKISAEILKREQSGSEQAPRRSRETALRSELRSVSNNRMQAATRDIFAEHIYPLNWTAAELRAELQKWSAQAMAYFETALQKYSELFRSAQKIAADDEPRQLVDTRRDLPSAAEVIPILALLAKRQSLHYVLLSPAVEADSAKLMADLEERLASPEVRALWGELSLKTIGNRFRMESLEMSAGSPDVAMKIAARAQILAGRHKGMTSAVIAADGSMSRAMAGDAHKYRFLNLYTPEGLERTAVLWMAAELLDELTETMLARFDSQSFLTDTRWRGLWTEMRQILALRTAA